jgi:hypothetical protein
MIRYSFALVIGTAITILVLAAIQYGSVATVAKLVF